MKMKLYRDGHTWVAENIGEALGNLIAFSGSLKLVLLEVDLDLQLFGFRFDLWLSASKFYGQAGAGISLFTPAAGFTMEGGVKWTGELERLDRRSGCV
jgi:hypothetical protein